MAQNPVCALELRVTVKGRRRRMTDLMLVVLVVVPHFSVDESQPVRIDPRMSCRGRLTNLPCHALGLSGNRPWPVSRLFIYELAASLCSSGMGSHTL